MNYSIHDRVFFTSDQHFGHENIIKYCERPFINADQMDDQMVENWNSVIGDNDVVYHLGDFTLGYNAGDYLSKLNGRISILRLRWHHDQRWINKPGTIYSKCYPVVFLEPIDVIYISDLRDRLFPITLSHYPMAEWEGAHYETWHLHGHSHGKHIPGNYRFALDVGVDCMNFYPVSLGGVLENMYNLGWIS